MRLHFSVRTLFYGLAAVVIAAVALLGVTIYLRGVSVPNAVLNSPLAQRIGARYGIRFHVDNLRIGCLSRSCPR